MSRGGCKKSPSLVRRRGNPGVSMKLILRCLSLLATAFVLASFLFPTGAYAASSGRFYSLNSDGTLYFSDDNYTTAHEAPDGTVEYTTTALRVGQDNATGTYYVWRGVFFFDTLELPEGAIVSSAFVTLRGKANHSDTDFNLVLVQPGDMQSPMQIEDYGTIYGKTSSLNDTFSTSTYASSMQLDLNGDGESALMHGGITVFGLRSSRDISGTAPAGTEYLDIYSSESPSPPILTVNYYTMGFLGVPDTKEMTSVAVFRDYYETGDQLYIMRSNIDYKSGISDLDPTDYFSVQLRQSDNVMASVPLWSWGYVPVSIYLSAANAVPVATYTLIIIGNSDKFISDVPYVAHTIVNVDYKGTDMSSLDSWVMATAIDIGRVAKSDVDYYRTQVSGAWVLNDMGGDMFIQGIPLLDSLRQHLFANPNLASQATPTGDTYAGTLWANWGPEFTDDWEVIGDIGGVSGMLAASLAWLALGAWVVIVVQKETGKPALGMIPATGVLLLGSLLGVPLFIILGATAVAAAYFYKELLMGGTA